MRKILLMIAGLALGSAAAANEKLAVLLIDGQNNHNWKATSPVLKATLEKCGRFTVEVSTTPADKAPEADWDKWRPEFSNYQVVVSNYNGKPWPAAVQRSFEAYVGGGGGFVCIHAANNSFPLWPEYNKMIGLGGWGGRNEKSGPYLYVKDGQLQRDAAPGPGGHHGAQHEFTVELFDKGAEHPITKGMPAVWKHAKDELYDMLRGPAENVTILATSPSPETKRQEPMIMVIDYGKGRVFHTPMGHADYSMKCVGFQTVLVRGTEWAATGKVTLPVPASFPTKDAVLPAP